VNVESDSAEGWGPSLQERSRFAPQWSLLTLLLLTAAVAVWVGYFRYRYEIPALEQEIDQMKRMVRELIVEDPQQIAVVKLAEMWMDDQRWDIHLPEGEFVIRLATRQIGKAGLAPVAAEAPIDSGRHQVELQKNDSEDGWRITVLVDDRPAIEAAEEAGWYPGRGSEGPGGITICEQQPPERPVELHRHRFSQRTKSGTYKAPEEPTNGLLLWVERVDK
jgi:hypothetical protein